MINQKWTPKLKKWLEEGEENTDNIVRMPWDVTLVEGEKTDHIQATLPSSPFTIDMFVGPEYAAMYIDMKYPTDALDAVNRMRLYKRLLNMNRELNSMKTSLAGEDDAILLTLDLDLASLSEKEFDNALASMVIGSAQLASQLGMDEALTKFMMARTMERITGMLKDGKTKDDVMHYLLHRVGVNQEMADMFWGEATKQDAEALADQSGEHPADRYIR